jgi:hypothetical protein
VRGWRSRRAGRDRRGQVRRTLLTAGGGGLTPGPYVCPRCARGRMGRGD